MKPFGETTSRKKIRHWRGVLVLLGAAVLSGCAGGGGGGLSGDGVTLPGVGPVLSSNFGKSETELATSNLPKIEVLVPVFDPNLPKDSDTWKKKGIYPELRRAEANRFALKMKSALEDTQAFGAVRVVPNTTATGDLYIIGKIIKSNGENVEINISATDISGKKWFAKNFKHRVREAFHDNIRNKGKDPYAPVFEEAAAYIVKKIKKYNTEALAKLQDLSEIRFGTSLSQDTFSRYLKADGGRVVLAAAPAEDDPELQRIKPIRVRHQLFIDRMQTHYANYDQKLNDSYLIWQQQSLVEVKAARKAKSTAITQGILGGLLVVAGVAVAAETNSTLGEVAAVGALSGGAILLGESFHSRSEMKVHREALAELGKSIDIEIAPQAVKYENETAKLTGDAAQQYEQWIAFLKRIYDEGATPEKTL